MLSGPLSALICSSEIPSRSRTGCSSHHDCRASTLKSLALAEPRNVRCSSPVSSLTIPNCHLRLKRPALDTRNLRGRKFDVFDVLGSKHIVRGTTGPLR